MDDIVKAEGGFYDQYEKLILERDHLKKEAYFYEGEYRRVFGKLNIALNEEKLRCGKKKSALSFCVAAANRGEPVDIAVLREKIRKDTDDLSSRLDDLIMEYKNAQFAGVLTESGIKKVKETYHRLVKKLHPDINPKVADIQRLRDLWYEVVDAYNRNDLNRLTELEVLANKAMGELENGVKPEICVPGIELKIEAVKLEIEEIKITKPYTFKSLLENEAEVLKLKTKLLEEIKVYQEYNRKLEIILKDLLPEDSEIEWDLN